MVTLAEKNEGSVKVLLFVLYFQKLESSQQSKVSDGEIQFARTPLLGTLVLLADCDSVIHCPLQDITMS